MPDLKDSAWFAERRHAAPTEKLRGMVDYVERLRDLIADGCEYEWVIRRYDQAVHTLELNIPLSFSSPSSPVGEEGKGEMKESWLAGA